MTNPGFYILIVLVLVLIWLYTAIAKIPGSKARERGHPQADAINVLGWVGPLLGVAPWLVALVWAHTRPLHVALPAEESPAHGGASDGEPPTESAGSTS